MAAQGSAGAISCNIIVVAAPTTPEVGGVRASPSPHPHPSAARSPVCVRRLCLMNAPPPPTSQLSVLNQLPAGARVVAIGRTLDDFAALSDADWASINVLVNCGVGTSAGTKAHIQVGKGAGGVPWGVA